MAGIKNYSTTAASNATVGSVNFAEGQVPSTVNDSARQFMADMRSWYETTEFRDWGHTVTYATATTFTVATDVTLVYTANRPIKCTDSATLYGYVASSSYSSPNTTVTVTLDSGSLSASLTAVAVGDDPTHKTIDALGVRKSAANTLTTTGDLLYASAANTPARLAVGTSTQVMIGGTTPAYGDVPINGLTEDTVPDANNDFVITYDASAAVNKKAKPVNLMAANTGSSLVYLGANTASNSATIAVAFTSSYDHIVIDLIDIIPATNAVYMYMQVSSDGGSTWGTAAIYQYAVLAFGSDAVSRNGNSAGATNLAICGFTDGISNNASNLGVNGTVDCYSLNGTGARKSVTFRGKYYGAAVNHFTGSGDINSTAVLNAVRFVMSSGNITSGTMRVFGVKNS